LITGTIKIHLPQPTTTVFHFSSSPSIIMLVNAIATLALGLASLAAADPGRPCGFKIAPCLEGTECVPNSETCINMDVCPGTCLPLTNEPRQLEYQSCGGKRAVPPPPCHELSECRDDPRTWNGNCGLACDKPGICIPVNQPQCNGFLGTECPSGMECFDILEDDCDPLNGGSDCMGVCL
jgi:hypothetical protein